MGSDNRSFHRSDNYCALFGEDATLFGEGLSALIEQVHPGDRDGLRRSTASAMASVTRWNTGILRADGQSVHYLKWRCR